MKSIFKKICIASDHAGFGLKDAIVDFLVNKQISIIDLGPKAGENGGFVIATGTPEFISKQEKSITGKYLIPKLNKQEYNVLQSSSIK